MADDQIIHFRVEELPARAAARQHFVAEMFKHSLQLLPLDVRSRRAGTQPFQGFLVLRHELLYHKRQRCNYEIVT